MRKAAGLDSLGSLLKKQFFTAKEARERGVYSALLGYYVKSGNLRRLGHGIYQSVDYEGDASDYQWADLIEAVHSIPNGVVCLITALSIYGITDEIPRQHWIAVPHSTTIRGRRTVRIIRLRNMELGKTVIALETKQIPIFDVERTIIDSFRLLPAEIAVKALKMAIAGKAKQKLDLAKLQDYARILRFSITPYLVTATT